MKKLKSFILVVFCCLFVAILFGIYLYFAGVPKTKARNFYNIALKYLEEGKKSEAESKLQDALKYWKEDYIIKKPEEIRK